MAARKKKTRSTSTTRDAWYMLPDAGDTCLHIPYGWTTCLLFISFIFANELICLIIGMALPYYLSTTMPITDSTILTKYYTIYCHIECASHILKFLGLYTCHAKFLSLLYLNFLICYNNKHLDMIIDYIILSKEMTRNLLIAIYEKLKAEQLKQKKDC